MGKERKFRFVDVELGTWNNAMKLARWFYAHEDPWVFRGERDGSWHLSTTLERALKSLREPLTKLADVERRILIKFRRTAPLHGQVISEEAVHERTEAIEWLTMVQHYGGPVRLLDFTRSFWVAVFFAIEPTSSPKFPEQQVVWAVNSRKLWEAAMAWLPGTKGEYRAPEASDRRRGARIEATEWLMVDEKYRKKGFARLKRRLGLDPKKDLLPALALPIEPERKNPRMAAQEGCFIFAMAADGTFEQNLFETFGLKAPCDWSPRSWDGTRGLSSPPRQTVIFRIVLPQGQLRVKEGNVLLQAMNISGRSLFPDAHGVARAGYDVAVDWKGIERRTILRGAMRPPPEKEDDIRTE